jgi:hypothetical protein
MKLGIILGDNALHIKKIFILQKKSVRIIVDTKPKNLFRVLFRRVEILPCQCEYLSGLGSVVGIVTGYRLDGPGIESRWRRDFPHLSRPDWGPPNLLYNGYRVFPGGKERPGRDADPSSPSAVVMKE